MKNRVIAIGDVIDDILVIPQGEIRIDTDTKSEIRANAGGSAGNFACWLASLNAPVDFVGRVGEKDLGRHNLEFVSHGVTPHLQADTELPTGSIVVLVQGQQRSFLTDRGANRKLDSDAIDHALLKNAVVLYISGYSLMESLSASQVQQIIERAKAEDVMVIIDPGSAGFIADFGVAKFLEAIAGADIVLPSWEEGKILTGEDRPEVIAEVLGARFPIVALTLGEQGAVLYNKGTTTRIEAFAADVVDATGAGDAFAAGLIANLIRGKDLETSAIEGARVAAKAVTLIGGRPKPQKA
jgi:sugar/nucleoside kinase (ribokinase family)